MAATTFTENLSTDLAIFESVESASLETVASCVLLLGLAWSHARGGSGRFFEDAPEKRPRN